MFFQLRYSKILRLLSLKIQNIDFSFLNLRDHLKMSEFDKENDWNVDPVDIMDRRVYFCWGAWPEYYVEDPNVDPMSNLKIHFYLREAHTRAFYLQQGRLGIG